MILTGLFSGCHSLGQFFNIVALVRHRSPIVLRRSVSGHHMIEFQFCHGIDRLRPCPWKSIGDEWQRAENHVAGRNRARLRTKHHHVAAGMGP